MSNSESRYGALAAVETLRQVERITEQYNAGPGPDDPAGILREHVEHRAAVVALVLGKLGDLSDFQRGFVQALAEYIDMGLCVGLPDLEAWRPDAAMTARQAEKERAALLADMLD